MRCVEPATLPLGIRVEEAVGGHQRDVGVLGPVGQHLLQHAGGRRLADRHRAREPDHERRARRGEVVQEGLLRAVQLAGGADVQAQQPTQREVDLLDLVEVEELAEAAQAADLVGAEPGSPSSASAAQAERSRFVSRRKLYICPPSW